VAPEVVFQFASNANCEILVAAIATGAEGALGVVVRLITLELPLVPIVL